MKSLQFFGAVGEVTGSSFLLTTDTQQFLIDCGMFQGSHDVEDANNQQLAFSPTALTAVFLTHAHLDHSGRLPLLTKQGYKGRIYMTEATRQLVYLELLDAAGIMQDNPNKVQLYTKEDVEELFTHITPVAYDMPFGLGDVAIEFKNAGHILGSASIVISEKEGKNIVFSGDVGNTPEELIEPTTYIDSAQFVVMEATYGDKEHPKEDPTGVLQEEINTVEVTGGVLLIPAFSVERTQELLHRIAHLKEKGLVKGETPVFLDSPMAIHVTALFEKFRNLYNGELLSDAKNGDPFSFPGLTMTEKREESKKINGIQGTKVIIAGSGMMSGGRILYHALQYLPLRSTRVLLVGYQAAGTMGRELLEGARSLHIHDIDIPVTATINEIHALSSHADKEKLLTWVDHIKNVEKVFVVHAEEETRDNFAKSLQEKNTSVQVFLPKLGETITL